MSNWISVKLEDICKITRGASPRPIHDWITDDIKGIPWVKIRDATSSNNRFIENTSERIKPEGKSKSVPVIKGDLIVSNSATPGLPKIMKIDGCIHDGWLLIRDLKGVKKEFLYYFFLHNRKYLVSKGTGTIFTNLKTDILKKHLINLPPEEEQSQIIEFLNNLDEKIELNLKTNKILHNVIKKLFQSWFIDFDPVKAKVDKKSTRLSKKISDLFPESFEMIKQKKIPKGWKIIKIKEILEILGGHAFKSKDYCKNGIFLLRTKNFDNGISHKKKDDVFLPNSFLENYKKFICKEFDYHLVMVGASIGKTGIIFPSSLPALRNQNMWCFRPKNKLISKYLTKLIVDMISKRLSKFAGGSARDFFKKEDFREYEIIIPPDQILNCFNKISDPVMHKFAKNFDEINLLKDLRDNFLPKLITGKLKLNDIYKKLKKEGL